jgi:restriction system protein
VGDPRSLLPHEVEIFVVRELRKAGLEPKAVKVRERTRAADTSDDYVVELSCSLRIGDADRDVLIECRNHRAPLDAGAVETLHAKLPAAKAQYAMLFSTSGFEPDAVRTARTLGMPLLAVADGKSAFVRSPWGMAGDPPAWVPEYMAELVDLDATNRLRHDLLASGGAKRILERFDAGATSKAAPRRTER